MSNQEPTTEARDRRVINEEIELPRTGIITKVYEHTQTDDRWNFHVDVRIDEEVHPRKVPVATSAPELIAPPRSIDDENGPDLALVQYLHDDTKERAIVTHILYNDEDRPPLGTEGIYRLRRGSLYLEAHPKGAWMRIARKDMDDSSPTAELTIDDTPAKPLVQAHRGELYMELVGDVAHVAQKDTENTVPNAEVAIDNSTDPPTIKINTTGGNISVNADTGIVSIDGGEIVLDGGADIVATEGDSVTVNGVASGSDTASGTIDSKSGNVKSS